MGRVDWDGFDEERSERQLPFYCLTLRFLQIGSGKHCIDYPQDPWMEFLASVIFRFFLIYKILSYTVQCSTYQLINLLEIG